MHLLVILSWANLLKVPSRYVKSLWISDATIQESVLMNPNTDARGSFHVESLFLSTTFLLSCVNKWCHNFPRSFRSLWDLRLSLSYTFTVMIQDQLHLIKINIVKACYILYFYQHGRNVPLIARQIRCISKRIIFYCALYILLTPNVHGSHTSFCYLF